MGNVFYSVSSAVNMLSWLSLFNLCFKPLSSTFQKIQLLSSFIGQVNINKQRNKIMAIAFFSVDLFLE